MRFPRITSSSFRRRVESETDGRWIQQKFSRRRQARDTTRGGMFWGSY
jgi:hypothetical protein